MVRQHHPWIAVFLVILMVMGLFSVSAAAADTSYRDLNGVTWTYADGEDTALESIRDSAMVIERAQALLISGIVNGTPVDAVRSNGFDNVVVGHKANEYILLPEGLRVIGGMTFYDFNFVKGVSIPQSVSEISYNAFDVLGREINNATVIYGAAGSEAERWASDNSTAVYSFETAEGTNFSTEAGENGMIYPSGRWYVPEGMKAEGVTADFSVEAESGYVIDALIADGKEIPEAAGRSSYLLTYTFSEASEAISVRFAPSDAAVEASSAESMSIVLSAGESAALDVGTYIPLLDGAAAEGADLSDIYDAPEDNAAGYTASMGVSTGDWYVVDGVLYKMIFGTNGSGENGDPGVVFQCKAQVINFLYETYGWVYGADYDLVRMYHFDSTVSAGNRKGSYDFHCAFAYKKVAEDGTYDGLSGVEAFYSENENTEGITDNSTLFVQGQAGEPTAVTVTGLSAANHTRPDGPQEATNFYGIGSAVLVDGGTPSMNSYADRFFLPEEATTLTLVDPYIVGGANPLYVLATSRVNIRGGVLFTAFSGGHGPYASLQGQITINADGTVLDENGIPNTDVDELRKNAVAAIPGRFGWAERNTYEDGSPVDANDYRLDHSKLALDEEGIAAYERENGAVTVVTTANSSGSILVTDSGGGMLLANRLSGTAYSTGSSGVYSMGGGSYVYIYNSRLESHIEPAINSVGEGYVFAFNSRFSGPVGVLSSGGREHVNIYNSEIATALDFDMDFYDLTDPNDPAQLATYQRLTEEVSAAELVNSNYLMIFPLNGDDMKNFVSNWYEDRTQVPGKNGGNIAVLSTTSASGITVDSTRLYNGAYADFGNVGAPNWLIAAAGGTSTFTFRHENSRTAWDLTGEDKNTTELYGNIYCAAPSGSGMWVTASGSADVILEDSEWIGTIEDRGEGAALSLDGTSSWTCTGTCTVKSLTLQDGAVVQAPEGMEIAFYQNGGTIELGAGTYEDLNIVVTKDGETVYDGIYAGEPAEAAAESDAKDAASDEAASGEMDGSGEMGGASGEAGGASGAPSFSTGASNCVHGELIAVTEVKAGFDREGVASFRIENGALTVAGMEPGEAILTLELTYADGSHETVTERITVVG